MPVTDTDFEREFAELVAEIRALPTAAPAQLRDRVRALGEPEPQASWWEGIRLIRPRRALLVLAPACLTVLVAAAMVHGLLSSGGEKTAATVTAEQAQRDLGRRTKTSPPVVFGPVTSPLDLQSGSSGAGSALVPAPVRGRPTDYDAFLRVRVKDLETLSRRSADAMRLARSLGGYVESVEQTTAVGAPGQADLVLRVPVARVEQALVRLAGLGTVVEQHVSIRDLQATVDAQRRRIRNLRVRIARIVEALRDPSLAADVKLNLQLQLEDARHSLTAATGSNKATLREAALSQVSVSLTTQHAVAATKPHHRGRLDRAARDAAGFLASAGAVVLYLLIVVSPLVLLALAWLFAARAYRRREERRLLAEV